MRIAAHFRIWDVDTWLQTISSEQYGDWLEFFELEPPLDFEVFDKHLAQLNASIVNSNANVSRNYTIGDFSLAPSEQLTPEQLLKKLDSTGL